MFTGGAMPWLVRYGPTLNVTREWAGVGTDASGTTIFAPPSSEAWNASVAVPSTAPGLWIVRYSMNPGRTVPSAKKNDLDRSAGSTDAVLAAVAAEPSRSVARVETEYDPGAP